MNVDWTALESDIATFLRKWGPIIGTATLPVVEAWLSNLPSVPQSLVTAVQNILNDLFPGNPAARLRLSAINIEK
jgi:hypothetical protein